MICFEVGAGEKQMMYENKFMISGKILAAKAENGTVTAFIDTMRKQFKPDDPQTIAVPIKLTGKLGELAAAANNSSPLKGKFLHCEAKIGVNKAETSAGKRYIQYLHASEVNKASIFDAPIVGGYVNNYSFMGVVLNKKPSSSGKSTGLSVMYNLEFSSRPKGMTQEESKAHDVGLWVYFSGKYKDSYVDQYVNVGDIVMLSGSVGCNKQDFTIDGKPVYDINLMGASIQRATPMKRNGGSNQGSRGSGSGSSGGSKPADDFDDLPF